MIFKNKVHKILLNFFLNMDLIKNSKMSLLQAAYQDNNYPKLRFKVCKFVSCFKESEMDLAPFSPMLLPLIK